MSAIATISAANRVINSALNVRYFRRIASGSWVGTSVVSSSVSTTYAQMYEYHRVASKSYRYVGLSYEAAIAAVASLKTAYTRTVRQQYWNPTGGSAQSLGAWEMLSVTGSECMASIVPQHVQGALWDVVVDVSEDDVRMSKTDSILDYAVAFAQERMREYDGETEDAS